MLDFPSKDGRWSWDELELLAMTLGYHHKIFYENVSADDQQKTGLKAETLRLLLEADIMYPHLNKTFNHQNGTYNIKVIMKAIELLTQRFISFSTLRMSRLSFQTYEHTDHAGLEDRFVLRAMQLCGKIMSPLKITQFLRHMGRLVPDRLMLYEFLELLSSADDIVNVKQDLPEKKDANGGLDERKLYELCSFEDELSTQEQRYYRYLDDKYEEGRRILSMEESAEAKNKITTVKTDQPKQWVVPPLANPDIRKEMTSGNSVQSKLLKTQLNSSSNNVKKRGCGMPCTCEAELVSSLIESEHRSTLQDKQSPGMSSKAELSTPASSPDAVQRLHSIVSQQDIDDTARKIQNIQWDIATHSQTLKKRMDSVPTRR